MRSSLIAFLWALSVIASPNDYYISSHGNDNNAGTSWASPWKSVSKVNSIFPALKPGDRILFKRGDTFFGTLEISVSGLPDSPITIGAYGNGNNPVLSGFTELKGWVDAGNGIYYKKVTSEPATSLITIDYKQYPMGRYPNSSYLIYESHKTNSSITDYQLTGSPNWTGAEIVINKQNWLLERCKITNHNGNTIEYKSFSSDYEPKDNRGYFIQNDLRTLDTYGEWFLNQSDGKLYIFLGNTNPDNKKIEMASVNNLVYNSGKSYIILDGLSFEGSIDDAVCFAWGDECVIKNCLVRFSGRNGLDIRGKNNKIYNNKVSSCNAAGIWIEGANSLITQNSVQDIGLIPGSMVNGYSSEGIFVGGENSLIQFNAINNVGRMGIRVGLGWMTIIRNNFVNNFLLTLNDGGGIYLDGQLEKTRIVEGNIVLNGKGNSVGRSPAACGIYLDEKSSNVLVKDNTVAYNPYGINLNKTNSNMIVNNLSFGNDVQIALHNTSLKPSIYGNKIYNNIFFSKAKSALAIYFSSYSNDISHFGEADSNYYVSPAGDGKVFYTFSLFTGEKYRTLSGWQYLTGKDVNSNKYAFSATDTSKINFYYNASRIQIILSLKEPMTDIKGNRYSKSVVLDPYSSIVLMIEPHLN
jgi:parallel beta-helix repeat protein